jgi:hypothetical protein
MIDYRPEDEQVDTSPTAKPVAPGEPEPGGLGIGQNRAALFLTAD